MKILSININGMSCGHCVNTIEAALRNLPLEKFNVHIGNATIQFDDKTISEKQIIDAINATGYEVKT